MKDVNELLADTDHARKAIERLAGMKLYEISAKKTENGQNPANYVVEDTINKYDLDPEKIKEITYIETLFLLNKMREDLGGADGGRRSWLNVHKNAQDDYLFRVNLLCGLVQRNEGSCTWLKIVCATPMDTLFSALSDIGGAQYDPELWNAYKKTMGQYRKNKPIIQAKEDSPSLKDVMNLFLSNGTKRWIPGVRSIYDYERETREAFIDISRLLVEIPVYALKKRISVIEVLDKYAMERIDYDEEEPCSSEKTREDILFT